MRGFLLLGGFLVLSSAAAQPRTFETVSPGQLFKGAYIDIRAPNSEGWRLVQSSSTGMAFAKPGQAPGESLSAQILMFELQPTETPEQFLALIRSGIEKDTDPGRFNVIRSTSEYTAERAYSCVRYRAAIEDRAAQTSASTRETLLLESEALYCRHPIRSTTGFAAIYSHRGRNPHPGLDGEAREFMQGIQVPSSAP